MVGTALPHETDFDISQDRFCWTDIFITWFEDYQLPYQFVRLLLKVEICSVCKCNYLQTYQADLNFRTIKLSHLIFFTSEDKFRDTLIFGGEYSVFPNPYIIGQTDVKLKYKEQSIRNYYFQVIYMLSSNDWMVRLIAINLR